MTLPFRVNVGCFVAVAADGVAAVVVVGGDGAVVAAVADNDSDNFDRQHSYRFVRVSLLALLLHDFVGMYDRNCVMRVIVLCDDGMNFVHKSFDLSVDAMMT